MSGLVHVSVFGEKQKIFVFLCLPSDGMRSVPLDEKLFTDFGETALRPDEVLLSIDIPDTKPVRRHTFSRNCEKQPFTTKLRGEMDRLNLK